MAEITQVLGIVGMSPKGEYDSSKYYEKLNVVTYNGSSYCAKTNVHGIVPTDSDFWDLIAEKGDTGPTGPQGYTPQKGTDYFTEADKSEIENDLKPVIKHDVQEEVIEQIEDLSSGTPLKASSVSDMTDTTRLYVNTSDGYVYYYNGTNWVQGWLYQASQIENKSLDTNKMSYLDTLDISKYAENIITGKYQYNNTQTDASKFTILEYIPIEEETTYSTDNLRFADFYDEDKVFITDESLNHQSTAPSYYTFTTPENAKYMTMSYNNTQAVYLYKKYIFDNLVNRYSRGNYREKDNLNINVNDDNIPFYNGYVKNLNYKAGLTLTLDGSTGLYSEFFVTPYLKCKENSRMFISNLRLLAFYDEDFKTIGDVINNSPTSDMIVTPPQNAKYFRYASSLSLLDNDVIYSLDFLNIIKDNINGIDGTDCIYSLTAAQIANNSEIHISENIDNKKNCSYNLYGEFSTFNSILVGHGLTEYNGGYIEITNTTINLYRREGADQNPTLKNTYNHGLSLMDYINVNIKVSKDSSNAKITLTTANGQFIVDNVLCSWSNGKIFAKTNGMTLSNVKFNYAVNDYKQLIYAYGDSYFSLDNPARWVYHLMNKGYSNIMINGYAGGGASDALACVQEELSKNKPRFLVWCLGMNNGDNGSINSQWLSATQTVISLCEENRITPILATIPNTPVVDNTYKNEWVRNSGKRYVDFAKCVGAEEANSSWYSGCLSYDNVHPTEKGAKLLCAEFIKDVPEIMQEN